MHPTPDHPSFVDRLLDRIRLVGAPVCIGLDPVVERLPDVTGSTDAERVSVFCRGVIDATNEYAAAFKPQSACFERLGSEGIRALEETIAHARSAGVPVIYDAKRGDIGSTAEHYAAAAVGIGADAITVNAFMGPSTVEPYLDAKLGVFVLVRTSNKDSGAIQSLQLATVGMVGDAVAGMTRTLGIDRKGQRGMSDVGAVVGLTKAAEAQHLRELMPEQVFLVPGYGSQGGSVRDIDPLLTHRPLGIPGRGVIVNASRSVIYAEGARTWAASVRDAACRMRDELYTALG